MDMMGTCSVTQTIDAGWMNTYAWLTLNYLTFLWRHLLHYY